MNCVRVELQCGKPTALTYHIARRAFAFYSTLPAIQRLTSADCVVIFTSPRYRAFRYPN